MGYAERVLQPGERIAYRANLHWVLWAPGATLMLLAAIGAIMAGFLAKDAVLYPALAACGVLFLVGAFMFTRAWINRVSTEIIVTDRRIIVKTGLIGRSSVEMNLSKVESVLVNQTIMGRILNYGTLVIRGVGSGLEPVANVAAPLEFHRHVNASTPMT